MASEWTINVLLPTGRCQAVALPPSANVSELSCLVPEGMAPLRLSHGGIDLDPTVSLEAAGLANGDTVSGMMAPLTMEFNVALLSGRSTKIQANQLMSVQEVRAAAQKHFQEGCLQLVTHEGLPLEPKMPLHIAGVKDGDSLTAIVQPVGLAATGSAFAFW